MSVAEEKKKQKEVYGCYQKTGDCSASWVTHNGCEKKTHIRKAQKVPQLRGTWALEFLSEFLWLWIGRKKANSKACVPCEDQSWMGAYVQGVGPSQDSMGPQCGYLSCARHGTFTACSRRALLYLSLKTFASCSMCSKIMLKKELCEVVQTQSGYTSAFFTSITGGQSCLVCRQKQHML